MKRKVVGIALFCLLLLVAIFAGYWDMLNTEKLRFARDRTAETLGGVAAMVEPRPNGSGGAAPAAPAAPTAVADAVPAPVPGNVPGAPASAPADPVPSFDILRVEPDGSTVLAGKAPAGSTVRLTDGQTVLGEETAGPGGDFAVVLDKPLSVGEHQIRIEATGAAGVATSREIAIVSVPEPGRENELLALVETPDQPSRLISVPKSGDAPAAAASDGGVATAPAARGASPATSAETSAALATAAPSAPVAASASPGASDALAVEAVEIEGDTIYVAGRAPAGHSVRVYVDNVFLAEDAGRTNERFLVTTKSNVPPGEHMVRADHVGPDGTVLARVEVPFVRPEGGSMAAIAGSGETAGSAAAPPPALPERSAAATERSPVEPSGSLDIAAAPSTSPTSNDASASPATDLSSAQPPRTAAAGPDEAGAQGSTSPGSAAPGSAADLPMPGAAAEGMTPAPAGPDDAVSGRLPAASGGGIAATRQAPLQAAGARVIIRRGDTLWRISRDTYGRGARYTVIYLANGDQIRDPDRIYPGQVFRMPDEAAPGSSPQ